MLGATAYAARTRGETRLFPLPRVNTRATEFVYAVSSVAAAGFQFGSLKVKPGVLWKSPPGVK